MKLKLILMAAVIFCGSVSAQLKPAYKKADKDSTELAQMKKQNADLKAKIFSAKVWLYDTEEKVNSVKENIRNMDTDLQVTELLIKNKKELIEAKKKKVNHE